MNPSKFQLKNIPKLPLSALVFYLSLLVLWQTGLIPSPIEIFAVLESLYQMYGLTGLAIASFLEGIVYMGMYFPGSFVVALAVFVSDGTFGELLILASLVAFVLTITSTINYILGRFIVPDSTSSRQSGTSKNRPKNKTKQSKKILSKGLVVSMIHPNALAFYFFHAGINRKSPWKILMVPIVMIPYGLILAYFIFAFKDGFRKVLETPSLMISFLLAWLIAAFFYGKRR